MLGRVSGTFVVQFIKQRCCKRRQRQQGWHTKQDVVQCIECRTQKIRYASGLNKKSQIPTGVELVGLVRDIWDIWQTQNHYNISDSPLTISRYLSTPVSRKCFCSASKAQTLPGPSSPRWQCLAFGGWLWCCDSGTEPRWDSKKISKHIQNEQQIYFSGWLHKCSFFHRWMLNNVRQHLNF